MFPFRLFDGDATQKFRYMNPRIPIVTTFGGHEKAKFSQISIGSAACMSHIFKVLSVNKISYRFTFGYT